MTRVLLIRANEIRHNALSIRLEQLGFEVANLVQIMPRRESRFSDLQLAHFKSRDQFEHDYFRYLVTSSRPHSKILLETSELNTPHSITTASDFKPDYIVTFGCSILGEKWINLFSNRILGIHLGLSPYYRGHGTNFFPFVNDDLGAVGYTLLNLDKGVDTGQIVHQQYAQFVLGDSIHSIGSRLIQSMFESIGEILRSKTDFRKSIEQPEIAFTRIYKGVDFTEETLTRALGNLRNGIIEKFLENQENERSRFPLILDRFSS